MRQPSLRTLALRALPPLMLVGALAACQQETTPTTDTVDESGGDLIVTQETPGEAPVTVPDTPMTPVPADGAGAIADAPAPAASGSDAPAQ